MISNSSEIMNFTCTNNTGGALSERYINLGYTKHSSFKISIEKSYQIFALSIWNNVLLFLLCNDENLPDWVPAELFSSATQSIPEDWLFSSTPTNQQGLQALWGYRRIVEDESHYDALLERDPIALRYFYEVGQQDGQ